MRQNPGANPNIEEGLNEYLDEEEEKRLRYEMRAALPEITPDFSDKRTIHYSVEMFQTRLIQLPHDKTTVIETQYLFTCTAVAIFIKTGTQERFCLLSHYPYYLGDEFDDELNRYDIPNVATTKKKAVVVFPSQTDNTREEVVLEKSFTKHHIGFSDIRMHLRENVPLNSYKEYNGRVKIIWKPDEDPTISFLDSNGSWKEIPVPLNT